MRDKGLQVGLLFNHLPELIFFATGLFRSEADYLVKMSQKITGNPNITRDHQIFRNAANKKLEADELSEYWSSNNPELGELFESIEDEYAFDKRHLGGWSFLFCCIKGFKRSNRPAEDGELMQYLTFIEEHCLLEHETIKKSQMFRSPTALNDFLSIWLYCGPVVFENSNKSNKAEYLITMVMYWAALFEKFLEIVYLDRDEGYRSVIMKTLPKSSKKKGSEYLHPSTEALILFIKNKQAENQTPNRKYKWSDLYEEIARAQLTDPNLNTTPIEKDDLRLITPDTSAIKKQITRWREGSRLSIEHFKKYFLILHQEYDYTSRDYSLFTVEFVNLFTYIQKELLGEGVSPQIICDCFAKYEEYKDLVNKRFEFFQVNNVLKP